jgi:hypothetical protein
MSADFQKFTESQRNPPLLFERTAVQKQKCKKQIFSNNVAARRLLERRFFERH